MSQYDPKSTPLCPYCKAADKDRDHVLKCIQITKVAWHKCFIISLQMRYMEMNTWEMLTTILTDAVQS
jgi:hypothetical protein